MGGGWKGSLAFRLQFFKGSSIIMDDPGYSVLREKLGKIKKSNLDTAWLGEKLLEADIIDESDVETVNAQEEASARRAKLTEMVMGSGAPGVFQTFVNILSSKAKLKWLANDLKGKHFLSVIIYI